MKIFVKNKGAIDLNDQNYVASGGEGDVYAKNGIAYKIYNDPSKMISVAKIQELSQLSLGNIIRPLDVILNDQKVAVGYTMRHLKDNVGLCQTFTKAWRDRNKVQPDDVLKMVRHMQDTVKHIHQHQCLIVDLNEMNFLVDDKYKEAFFIDVDSYQTQNFKATALMESVRDRHTKGFNQFTDWFSFGIVTFQMFVGIHPYKGKHTINDMDQRMLKNISVFNKDVSVPKVCYPFDVIPQVYKDWYQAMFEHGKRVAPPTDLNAVIQLVTQIQKVTGGKLVEVKELEKYLTDVFGHWWLDGVSVTNTKEGVSVNNNRINSGPISPDLCIGLTPQSSNVIAAHVENHKLKLFNVTRNVILPVDISAEKVMGYNGRLYIKHSDKVMELEFAELGGKIQVATKYAAFVLENAAQLFEGVVMQNTLGRQYAYLFPKGGTCHQIEIKEAKGYRIVDAKFDNNVLMVVGVKNGKYDKFIIRFDQHFVTYDLRMATDISYSGLNFVVLDNGICVHINENEEVEVFANRKDSTSVKVVDDPVISSDMKLYKNGVAVLFAKGATLYTMKLK